MDCFCASYAPWRTSSPALNGAARAVSGRSGKGKETNMDGTETLVSQSKLTHVPTCRWKTGLRMKSCLGSNLQQSTGFGKISGFSPSHTLKPSHLSLQFALTLHLAMARAGRHALPDEKTRVEAAWNFYRALVAVNDQTWMVSKPIKTTSYFQMVNERGDGLEQWWLAGACSHQVLTRGKRFPVFPWQSAVNWSSAPLQLIPYQLLKKKKLQHSNPATCHESLRWNGIATLHLCTDGRTVWASFSAHASASWMWSLLHSNAAPWHKANKARPRQFIEPECDSTI